MLLLLVSIVSAETGTSSFSLNLDSPSCSAFPHIWSESVGSGHAALATRADYQKQIKRVHDELGIKRVRFHGIFDDDMNVVNMLSSGEMQFSFYNIDIIYDYLLSIGVSPLVELSFSPSLISTGNKTLFHYKANINMPDLDVWSKLVQAFANHLISRYGIGTVKNWYFEVWNEYNCGFLAATDLSPRDSYYLLYNATFVAMKAVDSRLQVGGPVTCGSAEVAEFMDWSNQNGVGFDFISTHIYPTDPVVTLGDIATIMQETKKKVEHRSSSAKLFYTEFNDGLFGPGFHDFPFAASFCVKLFTRIDGYIPIISWWTFSDIFEEEGWAAEEFDKPTYTGWGLLSSSNIAKPVFRAWQLLHEAGTSRVAVQENGDNNGDSGVLALVGEGGLDLFLFYNHWPPTDNVNLTEVNFSINITGANSGFGFVANLTRIDDNNGNAPQAWRDDNRPLYLNSTQIAHYEAIGALTFSNVSCIPNSNDSCLISITVPVQGLARLRIVNTKVGC